jgi:protein-S-isoprenylcysteine O-methyltransferase Ste14
VAPPFWINGALRSVIWLGAAGGLAYFKKPEGASLLAVRTDALGWLGGGIVLAGLAFHFWSSLTLAQGERPGSAANTPVTDGPFRYIRNPIYLAGITLLLGVGLLYATWRPVDLALPLFLFVYFHLSVVWIEEPALRRQFGSKYAEYCGRVPRWLPLPVSRARGDQRDDAADRASRGT